MLKKKEYIKPITEVIMVDTQCQMLSGSGKFYGKRSAERRRNKKTDNI